MNVLKTKPAAVGAVAAAAWGIFQAVYAPASGNGFDIQSLYGLIGAFVLAVYQAGWIRPNVTPVARPRAKVNGVIVPLVPSAGTVKAQPRHPAGDI